MPSTEESHSLISSLTRLHSRASWNGWRIIWGLLVKRIMQHDDFGNIAISLTTNLSYRFWSDLKFSANRIYTEVHLRRSALLDAECLFCAESSASSFAHTAHLAAWDSKGNARSIYFITFVCHCLQVSHVAGCRCDICTGPYRSHAGWEWKSMGIFFNLVLHGEKFIAESPHRNKYIIHIFAYMILTHTQKWKHAHCWEQILWKYFNIIA